jgi:hypothetical protein
MANIVPLDIVAPGAKGLNTEKANILLEQAWATLADNATIGNSGRLGSRKGWTDQTTTAIAGTPQIDVIHQYVKNDGTSEIISVAANKIYKNITDFTDVANDITSSTAPSADHWQFINFNGKCLGFQKGEVPIARTTGDFADVSYTGTGPDGNCAIGAFGRVWAADADLQTMRYSVLLDDTDYSIGNGGGTIDMTSVWTNGTDEIVAIAAIGANIVVFGKNHIVMWADGSGSELGIDPTAIEVVDTIEGTGCIARDSIVKTGEGDLIFLSRHGVQSLGRVIQFKSNPMVTLSRNVRTAMSASINATRVLDTEFDQVRGCLSPEEQLYILNFPAENKQYVFHLDKKFQDDEGFEVFSITTWTLGGTIVGLMAHGNGTLYLGSAGVVGKYTGDQDNSTSFVFDYESGWLDFEDLNHRLKMLKEILASVSVGNVTITWKWYWDFDEGVLSRDVVYTSSGVAEFNVSEFNVGTFSGAATVQRKSIPAYGEGQFLKVGLNTTINGYGAIVQHISVAPKTGRMVT